MQKSLKPEREELQRLKQRVDYLERINQQYISTLDTLNSLGDIHGNVEIKRSPEHIFTSTRQYLFRLARFHISAFLMVDEDSNSFEVSDCVPQENCNDIQLIIDELIERGEFGWALNQNRICEPQYRYKDQRILLHVLASRTRIRGMFIGVLEKEEDFPSVMTLGLISAILYNSAYALESSLLYKMISNQNEKLENLVDELSHKNAQLRDEIETRKKIEFSLRASEEELIEARQIAEAANRAKSEFLSRMSHELRTPLNAILGFTQVLELDTMLMSGNNGRYVNEINTAGEHLLTLINEVLDLSKIESGVIDIDLENVCLDDLIRESVSLLRSLARKQNVKFQYDNEQLSEITLLVDRTLFKQVLINLLSNAVKYNKEGGTVSVMAEKSGERVHIHVADTGIGIKEEKRDYLFQPFNRLGVETTGIEGSGIGLVITRHLVTAMNGEISFDSQYDQGTVFHLDFPAGAAQSDDTTDVSRLINNGLPDGVDTISILYIEDTLSNVKVIESLLASLQQISMSSAVNATEGISKAKELKPDVILLDLNLPDHNGFDVIRALKSDEMLKDIPVLAVSADAMQSTIDKAMAAGFDYYLTKPVRINELLTALGQVTQHS